MGKNIIIKLTKSGSTIGPFSVVDDLGNLLGENYTKEQLIDGVGFIVQDSVQVITLSSTGENKISKNIPVTEVSSLDLINNYTEISTGQIWKHLLNTTKYNPPPLSSITWNGSLIFLITFSRFCKYLFIIIPLSFFNLILFL